MLPNRCWYLGIFKVTELCIDVLFQEKTQRQNLQKWKVRHQHSKDLVLSFDFLSFQFRRSISIFIINFHDILVSHAFPSKRILFNVTLKGKALAPLGTCNTFEGYYLLIRWVYILQTIFVHLPMYFHPNGNEMNSLLEGVSGFSFTNRQCLFIKVEIHSGLKGNVFDLMKFWKRKYLAGQILGFEKVIHFLTPSHYLFFHILILITKLIIPYFDCACYWFLFCNARRLQNRIILLPRNQQRFLWLTILSSVSMTVYHERF